MKAPASRESGRTLSRLRRPVSGGQLKRKIDEQDFDACTSYDHYSPHAENYGIMSKTSGTDLSRCRQHSITQIVHGL